MKDKILEDIAQLICDNDSCDFVAEPGVYKFNEELVGEPCPKCGENLLTEEDYKLALETMRAVLALAGLGLIREVEDTDTSRVSMHVHDNKINLSVVDV